MGRRGPVGNDQGHRKHAPRTVISIVPQGPKAPRIPAANKAWSPAIRSQWRALWKDPLSGSFAATDMPALHRLFWMRDRWLRAMILTEESITVKGSVGQIRLHPLADYCSKLAADIIRLETELGLTPMARARLGITIGEAMDSLDEINAKWSKVGEQPSTAEGPADPRLAALLISDQDG
jgi:P27 family predicted phage terminase small subunit